LSRSTGVSCSPGSSTVIVTVDDRPERRLTARDGECARGSGETMIGGYVHDDR